MRCNLSLVLSFERTVLHHPGSRWVCDGWSLDTTVQKARQHCWQERGYRGTQLGGVACSRWLQEGGVDHSQLSIKGELVEFVGPIVGRRLEVCRTFIGDGACKGGKVIVSITCTI